MLSLSTTSGRLWENVFRRVIKKTNRRLNISKRKRFPLFIKTYFYIGGNIPPSNRIFSSETLNQPGKSWQHRPCPGAVGCTGVRVITPPVLKTRNKPLAGLANRETNPQVVVLHAALRCGGTMKDENLTRYSAAC